MKREEAIYQAFKFLSFSELHKDEAHDIPDEFIRARKVLGYDVIKLIRDIVVSIMRSQIK